MEWNNVFSIGLDVVGIFGGIYLALEAASVGETLIWVIGIGLVILIAVDTLIDLSRQVFGKEGVS
jgi:hypothetical protein